MSCVPEKISVKDKRYLFISWSDGSESMILLSSLRLNCPCAGCKHERENRPSSYIPLNTENQFTVKDIKPVGSYAIQIFWGDGHSTGIYSYEKLKNFISDEV
ncbi:MAG: DUF971 domain-containing protein [Ignavibacteria bacterium]|nr:DUF971 domain-containing protein [Ignavibacteria bacterium]